MTSAKAGFQTTSRIRLPDLGRRGEGWVVLQLVLFVAIVAAAFRGTALERLRLGWSGRSPERR